MKRKISVLLLLVCCIHFMLGFGFTKVSKVEQSINAIGVVTIESRDAIETAEKMYAELSPRNQKKVDNYGALLMARAELNRQVKLVDTAQKAIDAIQEPITRDSSAAIIEANRAYNEAREVGAHSYITGYGNLYMAIDTYAALVVEDADKLLKQQKYADAYELYAMVCNHFATSASGGRAYDGCRDASIGGTERLYSDGKMEETLNSLDEIDRNYGASEKSMALREKLLKRLEQQRPTSGKVFKNSTGWGYCEFTVSAGNTDACVKLEDIHDPAKYAMFFIRAGEEATVKVKDGSYIAKYATGEYWFNMDSLFGSRTAYTKAEDILEFTTTREGNSIYYTTIQITLYEVAGGDLETSEIDPNTF